MASNRFRYPPAPNNGGDTFSDNIVGLQLVDGGGLTQGNFEFTTYVTEKVNRTFDTGVFSDPISLLDLDVQSVDKAKELIAKNYKVYPNYDVSQVTNFSLYGSLRKRLQVSITHIINFFPAAIEIYTLDPTYNTGYTAFNIVYDQEGDVTTFDVNVEMFRNPFDIDYSVNSTRNISTRPFPTSPLRNMTIEYQKYALFFSGVETSYNFVDFIPSQSVASGTLTISVLGNPFSGASQSTEVIILKPNKLETENAFQEPFDEVEDFLLNRMVVPKYTATFQYPAQNDSGNYYIATDIITWPLDGFWNLDIRTAAFDDYLFKIENVSTNLDELITDLISRFLTTGAFKEFDTPDQKVEKTLQVYGRAYDETKKFIDALAYMNSVNYNTGNDIPSQLLQNLAQTLGWNTNISPITNEQFLGAIFSAPNESIYPGMTRDMTPNELNYQYYKNLILNSAYLFKSKGTRRAVEFVMRAVGAPESLIEFNETIYVADGPINVKLFDEEYQKISGGTISITTPTYDPTNTYFIQGVQYSAFTSDSIVEEIDVTPADYPIDALGYPLAPEPNSNYFFEKGAGWFESSPQHRSNDIVDRSTSVFTGANPNVQTVLAPFTYGQEYFNRFRDFPYMTLGFGLTKTIDNVKSWTNFDLGLRKSTSPSSETYYQVDDERLVLNAKNIELNLNMGQALLYDVWDMSVKYNYPIPATGLTAPYPSPNVSDWTNINPQPQTKTFFEFAQTFYNSMINVRNRQTSSDGRGGGYPTLQALYQNYLNSENAVNIPSNQYTYQKMIDFTLGLGDYWMRLVEQMLPSTTIWLGGQKMENSAMHRQKVVWRLQRGCQIVEVPCVPCFFEGPLFAYDCIDQTVTCPILPTPTTTFQQVLNQTLDTMVQLSGYTSNQCNLNSITSVWYVDLRLDSTILVQESFYTGYGPVDVPTLNQWIAALNQKLEGLYMYGLNYYISGTNIIISNSSCLDEFTDKTLHLNIGLDLTINCG